MKLCGSRAPLLFARYLAGALLLYLIILFGGLAAWIGATREDDVRYKQAQLQGLYRLIEQRYARAPAQEWPGLTQAIKDDFAYPFRLLDDEQVRNELPEAGYASLELGAIAFSDDDDISYKRIPDTKAVIALGSFEELILNGMPWKLNTFRHEVVPWLIFLLGLAMPFYALLYRLWRDIRALHAAASKLGAGDLSARVDTLRTRLMTPLGRIFNRMARETQGLLETQHLLAQAVVHEIRTPLARLRFGLDLMDGASDAASREKYRAGVEADIDCLDRLAQTSVVYARAGRQACVDKVRVDISHLRAAFAVDAAFGNRVPVVFSTDDVLSFWGDAELVVMALRNLVDNAQRYASSRISISLRHTADEVLFAVDDDGPGVPAQLRAHVYEPFVQVREGGGGYGLGLALVRSVAEKHGGWCDVGDSELGGARFRFALPDPHGVTQCYKGPA